MISTSLLNELLEFRSERSWEQFHTARNLSSAICVEASELLDYFRWARDFELETIITEQRQGIEHEIADVAILLSYLCHDLGISIEDVVGRKLQINSEKYPVEKAKGVSTKAHKLI